MVELPHYILKQITKSKQTVNYTEKINSSSGNSFIPSGSEHKVQYRGGNLRGKFSTSSDEIPHSTFK
jgi:hypothetical protein